MARRYFICCGDVGIECEFEAQGWTVEEVIELCAEHGRSQHGMRSFPPAFYIKMRRCIRVSDEEVTENPGTT